MLELNETSFSETIKADKPVVVDFYATWCPPCRAIAPQFSQWGDKHAEKAVWAKLNIDDAQDVAATYNVNAIPTFVMFKGGKEVRRWTGLVTEAELLAAIG